MKSYRDIVLTPEQTALALKYQGNSSIWHERCLNHAKVRVYIETNLSLIKEKSHYGLAFPCCRTGNEVYRRLDGQPIQEADLEALRALSKGQENNVKVSADGLEAEHYWLADSSG